jgi:hypothetical protein
MRWRGLRFESSVRRNPNNLTLPTFGISCFLLALAAWLTLRAVLPVPGAAGLIDARSDKKDHYFSVVLNVRDGGAYGHALLTWVKHRSDDDRSSVSFGYYAEKLGNVTEVFDTSGALTEEVMAPGEAPPTVRLALVFWVDQKQYDETLARIDRWRGKGRYKLFERDCVAFVADMIEPLHLKAQSRLFFPTPYQFVVSLLETNAQRQPQ